MMYAIEMKDGGIHITTIVVHGVSIEDVIAKWPTEVQEQILKYHEIDSSTVPTTRNYRDSWVINNGKITHDMTKAREIHREKIRHAANKSTVKAKKQKLLDMVNDPRINAAKTVDDLENIWPEQENDFI